MPVSGDWLPAPVLYEFIATPVNLCVLCPQSWGNENNLTIPPLLRHQLSPEGIFMKQFAILTATILFLVVSIMPAAAQEAPKSVPMKMYQVALIKHGPNWESQNTEAGMDIRMEVIENIKKGARKGLIVTAGLVNDETDAEFIIIFNLKNKYEALELLDNAPNYKNGMYKADIYSMFAPKNFRMELK